MEKPKDIKKILVIRSVPLPQTLETLKRVRKEYPNAKVSILVQPEVKEKIEESGLADRIILGNSGMISALKSLPLIARLRRERFDLVVITYNSEHTVWYGNVRRFASLIRAKKRVGLTVMDTFKPFSIKETIFKDLIFISLSFVVIVIPLFLIFIILLIPLVLFHRLKRGLGRRGVF